MWQDYQGLARRRNTASYCSRSANAAAKVFLVQHSIILQAWFDDVFCIGAVRSGQTELAPLLKGLWVQAPWTWWRWTDLHFNGLCYSAWKVALCMENKRQAIGSPTVTQCSSEDSGPLVRCYAVQIHISDVVAVTVVQWLGSKDKACHKWDGHRWCAWCNDSRLKLVKRSQCFSLGYKQQTNSLRESKQRQICISFRVLCHCSVFWTVL